MAKSRVKKRADGRYAMQIYLGIKDGKRKYKTVYGKSPKEVEQKALDLKIKLKKGIEIGAQKETFGVWAKRLLRFKQGNVSESQYKNYCSAISHLNQTLEFMAISDIKAYDLQEIIDYLARSNPNTGKPTSRRTLILVRSAASQTFRLAIENRVIDYNPVNAVKIPTGAPVEHRRALTGEEQSWIINTPHRAQTAAMVMMLAGLRRGEVIPLTWNDINLSEMTININKSVEMISGHAKEKTGGKTKSSRRIVDIPKILCEFLKQKRGDAKGEALVCPSAHEKMISVSAWRRLWDSYMKELNIRYGDFNDFCKATKKSWPESVYVPYGVPIVIPPITAHWLRHTFATLLYMAGVDVMTAMEQLGHDEIKTTLGIYTHLDTVYKRRNMNKLNEYLHASQMQVRNIK